MHSAEPDMIEAIASEAMELLGRGRQVASFSARHTGFGLPEAYAVTARVRDLRKAARGETPVGRKIGFTNTSIWQSYGISAPIWGYMYDATVHDLDPGGATSFALAGLPEPRIEPEIALHLACVPTPGMSEAELLACIDWVAPAFEVVFSIFPDWSFTAADAVAAYGVHAALFLGPRVDVTSDRDAASRMLQNFDVELRSVAGISRAGHARNVLGGPLRSLAYLLDELARHEAEPIQAGEIVTTGTLTQAMPLQPFERWTATFSFDTEPLTLTFR